MAGKAHAKDQGEAAAALKAAAPPVPVPSIEESTATDRDPPLNENQKAALVKLRGPALAFRSDLANLGADQARGLFDAVVELAARHIAP